MNNIPEEHTADGILASNVNTPMNTASLNNRKILTTIDNSSNTSIMKSNNQFPHTKMNSSTRSINSTNSTHSPSTMTDNKKKIFSNSPNKFQSPTRKPPPTPPKKSTLFSIFTLNHLRDDHKKSSTSIKSTKKSTHKKRLYAAPTELHECCKRGSSIKDILSRFQSKSPNILANSSNIPDNDNRLLLHLFSMNKHLSDSNNSHNSDIFQHAVLTPASMDGTDDRPLEIQLVLDYLLKSNPTAMCHTDKNGHVPFQYSIEEWITREHTKFSYQRHDARQNSIYSNTHANVNVVPYNSSDDNLSPTSIQQFFGSVISKMQKTTSTFSQSSNASNLFSSPRRFGTPDKNDNDDEKNDGNDNNDDDASHDSNDSYDISNSDDQDQNESNQDHSFPKNVGATTHLIFVLQMLSAIIQDLEKKSQEEKIKINSHHPPNDIVPENDSKISAPQIEEIPKKSFIQRTRGSSFRKKRKTIGAPSAVTTESNTNMAENKGNHNIDLSNTLMSTTATNAISSNQNLKTDFPTSKSIKNNIIKIVASIPNLIKTLLLIENDQDRNLIFDLPIIREIIFHEKSIGRWLVFMLRSNDRGISKRAVNYLKLISGENDDPSYFRFHQLSYTDIIGGTESIGDGLIKSSQKSKKRLTEDEGRRNDLYEVFSQLDGLIPSLLGLDEKMIEQAATTKIISRVLDKMVLKPFAISVLFLDLLFLILLITSTRLGINQFLHGENSGIFNWSILSSICSLYFIIRELGKAISLWSFTGRSFFYFKYLFNFWNMVDVSSIILAATSNILIRVYLSGEKIFNLNIPDVRIILALTIGLLWLRVLGLLKTINMQLATFVLAIIQITRDILWFLLILLAIIVCFAQMFDILLNYCKETNSTCGGWEYYFKVYSILLGDYGEFEREDFNTDLSMFLAVLFTFMVVIVLLNVLIAIVSDSYEKCLLRSEYLFGRARVMLLAELVSFQNLLQPKQGLVNTEKTKTNDRCCTYTSFSAWRNRDKKSLIFFALSSCIIVMLVLAESWTLVLGQFDQRSATIIATIITSIILFAFFIFFLLVYLSSLSSVHPIITTSIQTLMFRFVRTSADTENVTHEQEEWKGQVKFLKREMSRIAFETTKHTERLIQHESRIMNTKRGQLERRIVESEKRIMIQLKETQLQLENLSKQLSISNIKY